ncbi:MAG: hypothetical protein ACK56A_06820, partial [Bacteroidota bacterium]
MDIFSISSAKSSYAQAIKKTLRHAFQLLSSYIDADTYSFGWYAICRIVFSLRSKDYAEEKILLTSFERLCRGENSSHFVRKTMW